MDRQTITTIWIGGGILALLVFLIGPDNFLGVVWGGLDALETVFQGIFSFLGSQAFNVVRAAAIAIYAVFLVLAALAFHRGQRAVAAAIVVTAGFLILVWRSDAQYQVSSTSWLLALTLAIIGAVVMTQRLVHPDRGKQKEPRA